MTRDQLIREFEARRGTLPALVLVYGLILGTMVFSGMVIT